MRGYVFPYQMSDVFVVVEREPEMSRVFTISLRPKD